MKYIYGTALLLFTFVLHTPTQARDIYFNNLSGTKDGDNIKGLQESLAPDQRCKFEDTWICSVDFSWKKEAELFPDGQFNPFEDGASAIKLKALDYRMHLGGTWYIPFSIYVAEVSGTTDANEINRLKFLDPDQGKLNLQWNWVGRFRVGQNFCNYKKVTTVEKGICTMGLSAGVRYLGVERFNANLQPQENDNAYGFYIGPSLSFNFPIYADTDLSSHEGQLGIKISAMYYQNNVSDSTILFSDALDVNGNPLEFDKSYKGVNAELNLYITNVIGVRLTHFKQQGGNDVLGSQTQLTFSYEFGEN